MAANVHLVDRESQRLQSSREELVERIANAVPEEGVLQPLRGMYLSHLSMRHEKVHSVLRPSFCVIAQGSKEVLLGADRYLYDPSNYLLATLDLPRTSQVLEASPHRPYLSFRLELDPQLVSSVMAETGYPMNPRPTLETRAMNVSPLDANLLDAVVRLVRLLDSPAQAPILMTIISREIIYRLLLGDQGPRLRHLAVPEGSASLIAKAVQRIHQDFDQPLRVEDLARDLGMSVSGFHYHFKAVTAMSPLQFQKRLRLDAARRLMLSENLDATSAAFRVGYHDASHFSREYKSLFGAPPMRDVQQLRQTDVTG
ncbi:MAG: AraC family transcriptional regulator [Anaerolineae bacterium]